jgi:glucuronoarabinoxylan endo-1,4-beta-xylanase
MEKDIHNFGWTNLLTTLIVFFAAISGTKAANVNILTNPGFESGTTGWAARGGCGFTSTTSDKHSGSRSGLAVGRTATSQGIKQSLLGKMQPGGTYQISGWVKLSSVASDNIKVTIEQTDGLGNRLIDVNSDTGYNTYWVRLSGSFTLSVTGTLTVLDVYFSGPAAGVYLYLDDVSVFGPSPPPLYASVDTTIRRQKIEGFGAAGAWSDGTLVSLGGSHPDIYDTLFSQLGLDIYRVRNTHGYDAGYIDNTAQIVAAAKARNPKIKIMISSWSPPATLKSNGTTNNGGTLAKDYNDPNNVPYGYVYQRFAQWWRDSLTDFSNHGINAEYVNMQNEPDFWATWDSCVFYNDETSDYAGYTQAFRALYNKLNTMPNRPKLLAPEGASIYDTWYYINALDTTDKSNVYGYAHHLYGGGGSADNPDGYISAMTWLAANYSDKPRLQTEFSRGDSNALTFTDAMNLALLMHNSLTVENASAYLYWELFWGAPKGLVSISSTSYTINPVYYAFKHYSAFTDPNWQRLEASTDEPNNEPNALRISAYISPDNNQMSIVIINTSTGADIFLDFNSLGNFEVADGNVYRTSIMENCALIGKFGDTMPLSLPARSIATIALTGTLLPTSCQEVQNFGYRLPADLTGDCYVNFKDLLVMTEHWLETSPITVFPPEHSPDIHTDSGNIVNLLDFADLAAQWLTCNDPGGPGCISNWEN